MVRSGETDLGEKSDEAESRLKRFSRSPLFVFALLAAVLASCYFHPVRYIRLMSANKWIERAENSAQKIYNGPELIHVLNYIGLDGFVDFGNGRGSCIPLALLSPSGDVKLGWVNLPEPVFRLIDEIWIDPASGHFARILKKDETPIFAQAFDGQYLYTYDPANQDGIRKEPLRKSFRLPEDRAKLRAIVAGLPVSFPMLKQMRPEYLGEGEVYGSGQARVFQWTLPGPGGLPESKWQVKLRNSDGAIAEIICQVGRTQACTITPMRTSNIAPPPVSWDLSNLAQGLERHPEAIAYTDSKNNSPLLESGRLGP